MVRACAVSVRKVRGGWRRPVRWRVVTVTERWRVACGGFLLFRMLRRGSVVPALAEERQEHQAEHVGRGQQRGQRADRPEDPVAFPEGLEQDLVLARSEERRVGERWWH